MKSVVIETLHETQTSYETELCTRADRTFNPCRLWQGRDTTGGSRGDGAVRVHGWRRLLPADIYVVTASSGVLPAKGAEGRYSAFTTLSMATARSKVDYRRSW